MHASDNTHREPARIPEAYERFFDDLYHMGRPAEVFEVAAPVQRKAIPARPRKTPRGPVQHPFRPAHGRAPVAPRLLVRSPGPPQPGWRRPR